MRLAAETLDADQGHELLKQVVVPRPIAWVTTLAADGSVNAAPFSCFTFVAFAPMLLAIGVERGPGGRKKATLANAERDGELVVHVVTEALAGAMNDSARPLPPGASKLGALATLLGSASRDVGTLAGSASRDVATLAGERVRVPRIAAAPVALECHVHALHALVPDVHDLLVARVVLAHVDDAFVHDGRLDLAALRPIGRMDGDRYVRLGDTFELARPWSSRPRPAPFTSVAAAPREPASE